MRCEHARVALDEKTARRQRCLMQGVVAVRRVFDAMCLECGEALIAAGSKEPQYRFDSENGSTIHRIAR